MKSLFTSHDLQYLIAFTGAPCVSIYLPTHNTGAEIEADRIQLKNLLSQATETLIDGGEPPAMVAKLLEPIENYIQNGENWHGTEGGLALFAAPSFFKFYTIPLPLRPLADVGRRFHVTPLLRLAHDDQYYLLVLSKEGVRLLEGTRQELHPRHLADIPTSFREFGQSKQKDRQMHSAARPSWMQGRSSTVFHGEEDTKSELLEYFRAVEEGVQREIGHESIPLVLGGVAYLLPIYREVCRYPKVLANEVQGNLNMLSLAKLHERSWSIVESWLQRPQLVALNKLHHFLGTGLASTQMNEVMSAAGSGRIESLFISDQLEGTVPMNNGIERIANIAAIETVARGGNVYSVAPNMFEGHAPMAAVFRY